MLSRPILEVDDLFGSTYLFKHAKIKFDLYLFTWTQVYAQPNKVSTTHVMKYVASFLRINLTTAHQQDTTLIEGFLVPW